MDKNQITGLVIISLMLVLYFQFLAPKPEIKPQQKELAKKEIVKSNETTESVAEEAVVADTTQLNKSYGVFSNAVIGEEKIFTIENENVKISISSRGGEVKEVLLKKFLTYDKKPLHLLDKESSNISLFVKANNKTIDLTKLVFKVSKIATQATKDAPASVNFVADLGNGKQVIQTYSLEEGSYSTKYSIDLQGLGRDIQNNQLVLKWDRVLRRYEKNLNDERNFTTVNYYTAGEEFVNLKEASKEKQVAKDKNDIKWVAFKQKFFNTAIIADKKFDGGYFMTNVNLADTSVAKTSLIQLNIPLSNNGPENFTFFFGPNNYQILKKVTPGFSENITLGWAIFGWVNKFLIIPIFNFLENYIGNYGIIIIILVIIIKILLFPLSYKSYLSMAKTKVLKPELDEIKEKFGDDMQKVQAEQMKLYQKVGVNPLSGCIPLLLQLPILIAMFRFFPNSIELRQEGFLWADDLSTYDSIVSWTANIPLITQYYGNHISLFTILMTAATLLSTWYNNQMTSVQGSMKMMGYIMPVMFMFMLNSFSSGLTFYYFVSTMMTFGQQAIIRKFVDDNKIREALEENKKKNANKKKSKFQQRLEEAMKASEEAKKTRKK